MSEIRSVRYSLVLMVAIASAALTHATFRPSTTVTEYQVIFREPPRASTPYADSLTDVEEAERQGACLWEWMRQQGVEFTLDSVMAAGYWTDVQGGACLLIGEDDE